MSVLAQDVLKHRIIERMDKFGLSKADMAKRLNMDYTTFWRKLNGKRNIDVPLLQEIAKILGTSTAYLLGETDDPFSVKPTVSSSRPEKQEVRISEATRDLEAMLKDLVYEYPDLAIGFRDTRENWGNLSKDTKRSIADGLSLLFTPQVRTSTALKKTGKRGVV